MDEDQKRLGALEEAKKYAKTICTKKDTRPILDWLEVSGKLAMEHSNSSKYITLDDFEPNSSDIMTQLHIMYPIMMAFGFLSAGSMINFEEAMYRTVLQGG